MARNCNETFPLTLTFPVYDYRKMTNPKGNLNDLESVTHFIACDIMDVPDNIPMDTNPREQNQNTNVAKKIAASLADPVNSNFYILNRGLLLTAKSVHYDNKNKTVDVTFEDPSIHGDVDGGHTYLIIQRLKKELNHGDQFVRMEILTGADDEFQSLAASRNTSVQVKDKSIAELENRFDIIKDTLKDEPFFNDIYYKENADGNIDIADILCILNLFNIDEYPTNNIDNFPTCSYNGKAKCIDTYIKAHKKFSDDESKNPYVKMIPIMHDIFRLYEEIELHIPEYYNMDSHGYGNLSCVEYNKDEKFKTKFYGNSTGYISPAAFIYPFVGAFRALIMEDTGVYKWKIDPFLALNKLNNNMAKTLVDLHRALGGYPTMTGKNSCVWSQLFNSVKTYGDLVYDLTKV